MNILNDSESIFRYHHNMIALHGHDGAAALGWRNEHSQMVRFEALSGIANLNNCSVLDAGCGYGDLFKFMQKLYPDIRYTGIEQILEMLDIAKANYLHNNQVEFLSGNFITDNLPLKDYVLASGSLNYRSANANFIFEAISKLFDSCKLGLGFNLLSQITPNGLIVAYNPTDIKLYCNTLSKNVIFKNDYDEDDFTIYMYK